MCGIAGWVFREPRLVSAAQVRRAFDRLAHRGPDDRGWLAVLADGSVRAGREPEDVQARVVLLHTRLAIIDLSDAGHQPMRTADGRFAITFNGEIYNYRELRDRLPGPFRTQSDTEVLAEGLAARGSALLPELAGMFAFAFVDTQELKVHLARDAFGIKPLFVTRRIDQLAFASEIGALELDRRTADPERVYEYLRFGITDYGQHTLLREVNQVAPGEIWTIDASEAGLPLSVRRHFPASPPPVADLSMEEAARGVRDRFFESVQLHLRSDVPLGCALSGGIDSSAILCTASQLAERGSRLSAICYSAAPPAANEERWARLAAEAANATIHIVTASGVELQQDLDELILRQGEPFGSTSIYAQYCVFRRAREVGLTVMLDGQGADETFAGYRPFVGARLASLLVNAEPLRAARLLVAAARRGLAGAIVQDAAPALLPAALQRPLRQLVGRQLQQIGLAHSWFAERGVRELPFGAPPSLTARPVLREQLWHALTTTTLPHLLRYEDRNSMAFSIESRVPFLTPELVKFVFSLPENALVDDGGTTKRVLRSAMRGVVPDAILDRTDKVAFATPEAEWLGRPAPWIDRVIDGAQQFASFPIDVGATKQYLAAARTGRLVPDRRIWRWLNFIRWAELREVAFD